MEEITTIEVIGYILALCAIIMVFAMMCRVLYDAIKYISSNKTIRITDLKPPYIPPPPPTPKEWPRPNKYYIRYEKEHTGLPLLPFQKLENVIEGDNLETDNNGNISILKGISGEVVFYANSKNVTIEVIE